jgi:DNA-binding NtrC family response regulator
MYQGRIWIIAAEQASSDLVESVERQLSYEVTSVFVRKCRRSDLPVGKPEFILFDLRHDDALLRAAEWADNNRGTELVTIPWIGLAEGGIPLASSVLADQLFSGIVSWPFEQFGFERTLRLARKRMQVKGYEKPGESRSLAGTARTFRTFEPSLFPMLENLQLAAEHDFTILLTAETGTGKTTLAQIIHENSHRRDARFLTVPCASLPRELIESELFGHVKGAFTGADRTKEGKFDAVGSGTILLDEIDALETPQQAKLLRVLETGDYEPVGCNETRRTTARCVVASNHCLEKLVRENRFRQDLFFRLHQVKFEIPPLRERPRDIIPLTVEIIEECCRENRVQIRGIDPAMLQAIHSYSWPGNIRELRNELRRCALFARDGIVRPTSLSASIAAQVAKACEHAGQVEVPSGLAGSIALSEQQAIETMLRTQNYNRAATARALGISRVTLYNKIRRYNIRVDGPEEM